MHGSSYMGYGFASQGKQWSIAGVADLDHTGFADILWRNVESGDLVVWKSSPGLNFSSSYIGTASMDWHLAGAADLFGNGHMALIWRNLTSAQSVVGSAPPPWTVLR
jgi:hypothetical protein